MHRSDHRELRNSKVKLMWAGADDYRVRSTSSTLSTFTSCQCLPHVNREDMTNVAAIDTCFWQVTG